MGVVAQDPPRVRDRDGFHLGRATVVVDRWPVVRLANQCVQEVRLSVQQDTLGHHGRKGDPLCRIRMLLVMAAERLGATGWQRLAAGLTATRAASARPPWWHPEQAAVQNGAVLGIATADVLDASTFLWREASRAAVRRGRVEPAHRVPPTGHEDWTDQAPCRHADPELFQL